MNTSTLSRWWNSYAVRIPQGMIRQAGLKEWAIFEVHADKNGTISLQPKDDTFKHLYAQMSREHQHELLGPTYPVGNEKVIW